MKWIQTVPFEWKFQDKGITAFVAKHFCITKKVNAKNLLHVKWGFSVTSLIGNVNVTIGHSKYIRTKKEAMRQAEYFIKRLPKLREVMK